MDENKMIINRLLSDDLTFELEARLDEVLSADSPDYDEAERLTNQILALRGETPQKVSTAQIIDKICSGTEKSEYADEVTKLEVVSGKRSRRGIRTLLYVAAAAALIVGSVAAIRHLGGRVPVRDETPPEIISHITTTVYNTDKAAVTTSAFDGNTENENIEVIVQTTAPAEQNPVKTEAKRETDPAENNIPQQTETMQTSPVQEQTMALTTTFCEGNQIHTTTTTTTTANANDNSGEYVFSLTVSVVDYDTKEAIPGVSVKLIKVTSADDVFGIDSFNTEAIENGRYTVIDEWTTSKEPLHNIPTFNAGGYDDIYGYFFWISDLPADYYTPTDNYPEKDDCLYGDYKWALLAGTTDFEFGLRHIEEFQLEGTYSADISIVDYYGNYLAGIECSLREADTGKEVAAWTTGESAFHVEGLEYSFESIKAWSSSKYYQLYFKYPNGRYRLYYNLNYSYHDQLNGRTNIEEYVEVDDEESPLYTGAVQ